MKIQKKVTISGSVLVLLVGATVLSNFMQTTGKKIASGLFYPEFDAKSITTVSVGDSANGVFLELENDIWRVGHRGSSINFLADQVKVKTLLDKVGIMRKDQLISENSSNQKSLGVTEKTGITLSLTPKSGETTKFYVGNKSKNWRISKVRSEGSDKVFDVSGSIRFAFKTELENWRNRSVFAHPADSIEKIVIYDQVKLTRTADIAGDYWMVRDGEKEERANTQNIASYLRSLSTFVSNDWADSDTPESVWRGEKGGAFVDITLKDGTSERITVGNIDPSGRNRFFVKNSGREDLYFVVGSGAQVPFMNYAYFTYKPKPAVVDSVQSDSVVVDSTNETAAE